MLRDNGVDHLDTNRLGFWKGETYLRWNVEDMVSQWTWFAIPFQVLPGRIVFDDNSKSVQQALEV